MSPPLLPADASARVQAAAGAGPADYFSTDHATPGGGGTYPSNCDPSANPWASFAHASPAAVNVNPIETAAHTTEPASTSASGASAHLAPEHPLDSHAMFADTIRKRFSQPPTLNLPRGALAGKNVHRHTISTPSTILETSRYVPVGPSELAELLRGGNTIVLDIRPATAFAQQHIRGSINLCVPSTLLRRQEISLERLECDMLGPSERERLQAWRDPSTVAVVAVDTDTRSSTALGRSTLGGGGPCLVGLLAKFEAAGCKASLRWLRGGLVGFAGDECSTGLLDSAAQTRDIPHGGLVQPRRLPLQAFFLPGESGVLGSLGPSQVANPFINNIRQHLELGAGITDVVPLDVPDFGSAGTDMLPRFLRNMLARTPEERAQLLAEQFFELEKREQERLVGVMKQHSYYSMDVDRRARHPQPEVALSAHAAYPAGDTCQDTNFPLSITAALERGSDNRYNNLWTFEHSRVRLAQPLRDGDPGSTYINGSFVNPLRHLGGSRLYIATQGPLPSTLTSFWTMVWEQNVHVIVMLTRKFEAGRVQCDVYWDGGEHGDLSVKLVQVNYLDDAGRIVDRPHAVSARREIDVRRGNEDARRIVQLQYLAWPDHSVPATPHGLLNFIKTANQTQDSIPAPDRGPILVHCSAGIGRSGAYIVADAVLSLLLRARATLYGVPSSLPPLDMHFARSCWDDDLDIIYHAVSVLREQRMSMVQTTRQYVFTYSAVLHGLV